MPVWITKKAPISEWGRLQFRLIVAQQEMVSSLHLAMLVRHSGLDHPDDVVILLPDDSLRELFPGFIVIAESDIPEGMKLLVGTASTFSKRFPEIAAKLKPDVAPDEVAAV